jgi:ubiquinone/menaquinone biosynthesis C-methylase UbiE
MTAFKDLFSKQSGDYAKFRPRYPASLFDYLASLAPSRGLVWDCGTGNGQAAVELAKFFDRVIATDPSEKQIASAEKNPRVEYRVGPAEASGLEAGSVDLVTAAQAFHWFKQDAFFAEVKRVARPGGVLAFWCYELAKMTPEIDAVVWRLYNDILGPYWEKERKLVEEGYASARVPFKELKTPRFEMTARWSFEHLVGYLGTWSSLQTYRKKHDDDPLAALVPELKSAWGGVKEREARWQLAVRVSVVESRK